jgi:subtilisin family serine protease
MHGRHLPAAALSALFLAAGCQDSSIVDVPKGSRLEPEHSTIQPAALLTLECSVDVEQAVTNCRESAPSAGASGIRPALLGMNQIKMTSANNSNDTINEIYAFDATMQNLLSYAIGTPDGTTRAGSKVYFESGPTASSFYAPGDTGSVRVHNADGYADYTAGDQPYFFYDTILQPQQVSAAKRWEFHKPRQVKGFRFVVKIFTATPTEYRVPVTPPDTIPAGLYDSTNIILDSPHFGLSRRILKNTVAIRFHATATRDERQAAVDVIKGRVVGGRQVAGGDGYYFVRLTDNGTGQQIRAAVDTLSTIPSVATAQPEYLWLPEEFLTYVEPDEGGGDWRQPWRSNPSAADGENWALEAIAAPHAWGCSTGSPLVKVAVIDMGYFSNPDIMVNTSYAPALDAYTGWYRDEYHGTAVASIIGARGNNGQGITGTMWNADMRLFDISVHDDGERTTAGSRVLWKTPVPAKWLLERRLMQAINSGAQIINISMAVPPGATNSLPAAIRRSEVERMAADMAAMIQSAPNKPLLVIGAGNYDRDAYWSVLPVLARLLPEQVIVVAGAESVSDVSAPLWVGENGEASDYNSADIGQALVQISAPGESIGVLTPSGHTVRSGTSMSAPLVTGIAGLLKAFDSRLTTPQIKQLLIEGSVRGGRRTVMDGNVYLANAYQSLIAAAERDGAPLCGGMPVWRDEETGWVQGRRIVGTTGTVAGMFQQAGSDLVPMHGAPAFRVDQNYYGWFDGQWGRYPSAITDLFGNATNRSKLGQSHDGDSTVTVSRVEVSDTEEIYEVWINGQLLARVPSAWVKAPTITQCVFYHESTPGCDTEWPTWTDRITTHPAVGYSPRGNEVVLAVWKQKSTSRVGVPYRCGATGTYFCRDYGMSITTPASELVFIRVSDGQITERRVGPLRAIKQIGYSEDGQRLVLGTEFTFHESETTGSTGDTFASNSWYCQAQYISRSGPTLHTLPLKRQASQCYTAATFSP